MNYIANFILILFSKVPLALRNTLVMSFVEIIGRGLNIMNMHWVNEISHTGQVTSLEHYLNSAYGLTYAIPTRQTVIYINGAVSQRRFIYNQVENKTPMFLRNKSESMTPVYLRNNSEVAQYDFVIMVPSTLTFDINQMKAMADKYVIAGKRYTIQVY